MPDLWNARRSRFDGREGSLDLDARFAGMLGRSHLFYGLRFPLMALIALLGLSAVSMPYVIRGMDEAVENTIRHDIAWTGQRGRDELNDLMRAIIEFGRTSGAEAHQAAETAADIFASRLTTWRSGRFGDFALASPERCAALEALAEKATEIDTLIAAIDAEPSRRRLVVLLGEMEPLVVRIAADAYIHHVQTISDNREALKWFQRIQLVLAVSLLISSALLVSLLTLQNFALTHSHKAQKAIAQENAFLATHDPLTGLPNRKTFMTALAQACERASHGRAPCVIAIDLDGFKPINDVLGHKAGDLLLIAVGAKLHALAQDAEGGMAARFGGDEFLMLLEGVPDAEAAEAFAMRIREEVRCPSIIDNHRISIDATIGVAALDEAACQPEELIHKADIALNTGKAQGKGAVLAFHPQMLEGAALRRQLEIDLSKAKVFEEFEPYYQPVIDLCTRRIVGVEALVRWNHPTRGQVSPGAFIPVAESSGRIVEIGKAVIEKACRDAMLMPPDVMMAVNLSTVQLLRADVPELVWDALAASGLPPRRLKLEITESVLIHDARGTRQLMAELQEMDVTVALDDFGTGFSSLSYLRKFPFDELKIDRSFVADIEADRQAAAIVLTILGLARTLDMSVVAEGIESEEQALLLTAMGCGKGQGYHFGRPMPMKELMALFASQKGGPARQVA
jgi:diguanylate cyclase (GGDEF)-like protein